MGTGIRKLSAKKNPKSNLETKIGANHDETIFSNNYKHTPGRKKKLEIRTPFFNSLCLEGNFRLGTKTEKDNFLKPITNFGGRFLDGQKELGSQI